MFDDTVTVAKFIKKFLIYDSKTRIKNTVSHKNSPKNLSILNSFEIPTNNKKKNFDLNYLLSD